VIDRRLFLRRATAALALPAGAGCSRPGPWTRAAYRRPERSRVAILGAVRYEDTLVDVIRQGIRLFRLEVEGRRVVLKPNIIEVVPNNPAVTTHPAVIAAAIEAFRQLGARDVIVAEGPGHRRDTEYLLTTSGVHAAIRAAGSRWVDLNHDDVVSVPTPSRYTRFERFYLPTTVVEADLLVSMPKLKTHHWAGITASLKNMFGILPGAVYGWPKNPLHWAGIHESILDINAALTLPQFAIVDGIVGMEGDGPIRGEPKSAGVLILGDDLVAVDATAARIVGMEPARVKYLQQAGEFLGNMVVERIDHVGEPLERVQNNFRVIEPFEFLKVAGSKLS
jgi:uncharacterized protein (DUF362 family)